MENKSYSYKNVSHFSNHLLKINNEPNKIIYSDKQFEEDLNKWLSRTKTIQYYNIDKLLEIAKSIKEKK